MEFKDLISIERIDEQENDDNNDEEKELTDNKKAETKSEDENEPERVIYINNRDKDDELQKEGSTINILIEASRKRKTNIYEVNFSPVSISKAKILPFLIFIQTKLKVQIYTARTFGHKTISKLFFDATLVIWSDYQHFMLVVSKLDRFRLDGFYQFNN
jgi:hypothetical protein